MSSSNAPQEKPLQVEKTASNVVYKIISSEDLNLAPTQSKLEKRGRPKKRPPSENTYEDVVIEKKPAATNPRTRSGRIVRPPRHIQRDFKKIEINDCDDNSENLVVKEFTPLNPIQPQPEVLPKLEQPLGTAPRKRNISPQYCCPKCHKAYLGKSRMLKHLQDFPDHGPVPLHCRDNNFEAWNFLVDVTHKCSPGSRGKKFCAELTNLLHNLRLLKRVLFKAPKDEKNVVKVDAVLGRALDLEPGNYRFNESELLKDVTVFTLLQNSQFFDSDENTVVKGEICKNGEEANFGSFDKKQELIGLHNEELLSENSLLNLRNSVDDLILPGNSEEVMNVDQFVNERFKNMTGSDVDLGGGPLNMDLQGLDLFEFHNS